jgi:hypothetical protein
MPASSASGGSSGAPPKYRMTYTPPGVSCADLNNSSIGATAYNTSSGSSSHNSSSSSSSSSVMLLLHPAAGGHQATTATSRQQLSMFQLWEDGGTFLMNAASPSKATHHELRHP